jgi:hypothetical protein
MFSWIIETILGGLPEWTWPAVAGGGFAVYFFGGVIGHFPTFKPYMLFIKPLGLLVCIGGIFMFGGSGVNAIYQAQIKEQQAKIAVAQQASSDANANIQTKIVTKTKVIHDTQIVYQEKIKEVEKKIDADCKLDPEAIGIINGAAKNPLGVSK